MIRVEVSAGEGDRPMRDVSDDLIISEHMAMIRARQELAHQMTIIKSRGIQLFKPENLSPGDSVSFVNSRLNLAGTHRVNSCMLTINLESIKTSMFIEQYGVTP